MKFTPDKTVVITSNLNTFYSLEKRFKMLLKPYQDKELYNG